MKHVHHERLPRISLLRLAFGRKSLTANGLLLTHTLDDLDLNVHPGYRAICDLGHTSGPLPICWPFIAAAPLHKAALADPGFPFPALGLVHQSQEMEWLGSPLSPTPIACRVIAGRTMPSSRGIDLELETIMSQNGSDLWRSRSVIWCRRGPGGGPKRAPPDLVLEASPKTETVSLDLPENLGRRFARVAGDRNPIHQHALLARPFGFKRAIIHGMWTVARALGELEKTAGRPALRVRARFIAPVFIPGEVDLRFGLISATEGAAEVYQEARPCVQVSASFR